MWEPFGTAPANATASWRSGPNERDIPSYGKTSWRHQIWRRAIWVVIGLFAPEGIASIAFRQWARARTLEYRMKTILGSLDPGVCASVGASDVERDPLAKEDAPIHSSVTFVSNQAGLLEPIQAQTQLPYRKYPWTRVHSHFSLMGGFAMEIKSLHPEILGDRHTRRTLTPVAIRTLAKNCPARLPDISKNFIRDKSKANSFAKLLVCVQACWFIAQTIGRLATRLPISLLEMNTLLHAVCCLLIYLAWWHKPLDIEEPYIIDTSDQYMQKVLAWMAVKDALPIRHYAYMDNSRGYPEKLSSSKFHLIYEDDMSHGGDVAERARKALIGFENHNKAQKRMEELFEPDFGNQWVSECRAEQGLLIIYPGQRIHGFVAIDWTSDTTAQLYTTLSLQHIGQLKLAHSLRHDSRTGQEWDFGEQSESSRSGDKMLTKGTSIENSPDEELEKWRHSTFASPSTVFVMGMYLAGSLYGGFHLLAWYGPFTTRAERLLWRISCFIIVSPILILLGICLGMLIWEHLIMPHENLFSWLPRSERWKKFWSWFLDLLIPGLVTIVCIYIAARLYLVVECFINIAYLPEDVFKEPRWSRYPPHFGAG
ncbi:hypothetical protein BKA63DRAFT_548398 [Paraphoma chrysanthemicola]|nr:hypothetical protein BKA63DRAFT_548398 [Paraphoma chrysanthemicola]